MKRKEDRRVFAVKRLLIRDEQEDLISSLPMRSDVISVFPEWPVAHRTPANYEIAIQTASLRTKPRSQIGELAYQQSWSASSLAKNCTVTLSSEASYRGSRAALRNTQRPQRFPELLIDLRMHWLRQ